MRSCSCFPGYTASDGYQARPQDAGWAQAAGTWVEASRLALGKLYTVPRLSTAADSREIRPHMSVLRVFWLQEAAVVAAMCNRQDGEVRPSLQTHAAEQRHPA